MEKLDIIDHIAIQVNDIKKSVEFYTNRFKCKVLYQDESWGFLEFENTKLAFVKKEQHPFHFAILKENESLIISTVFPVNSIHPQMKRRATKLRKRICQGFNRYEIFISSTHKA